MVFEEHLMLCGSMLCTDKTTYSTIEQNKLECLYLYKFGNLTQHGEVILISRMKIYKHICQCPFSVLTFFDEKKHQQKITLCFFWNTQVECSVQQITQNGLCDNEL